MRSSKNSNLQQANVAVVRDPAATPLSNLGSRLTGWEPLP